ncbi:hypothetical protein Tco_0861701 [Tanacetum coccineum]|uniref:Uncharacterized protein n=1 Tax=Tanacetum coccineum TaxID=301880 RepID=A0ABQ5BK96_9ASTR
MISIRSKMEDMKSSRLMETVDIIDLIPFIGNVLYITQDRALSVSESHKRRHQTRTVELRTSSKTNYDHLIEDDISPLLQLE